MTFDTTLLVVITLHDASIRIARELHDAVGQQLTALRLLLEPRQSNCRVDSRPAVHPTPVLYGLGLAESLRQLVRRWTDCALVDADCHCDLSRARVSRDHHMTVYGIAHEALNVMKHAHATHVDVRSEIRHDGLVLIVQDDGIGFEPIHGPSPVGSGIHRMHERAALAGGSLRGESSPGRGTTMFLRLPLPEAPDGPFAR